MSRKKFSSTKLVKQVARERIGAPKASRVVGKGKSGRRKKKEDPEDYPEWMREEKEESSQFSQRQLDKGSINQIAAAINCQPRKLMTGRRRNVSHVIHSYSPEIMRHADFLRLSQGDTAANAYLNEIRNGGIMEDTYIGTTERALKEAEQKVLFFGARLKEDQAEVERWQRVVTALRDVIKVSSTPVTDLKKVTPIQDSRHATGWKRGESHVWGPILVQAMNELRPKDALKEGVDRKALANKMHQLHGKKSSKTTSFSVIARALEKNQLVEVTKKHYALASWLEESEAKTA